MAHDNGFPVSGYAGPVLSGERLAPRTTWRMGGPARWLVQPGDGETLARLWGRWPEGVPRLVLGGGSNLLIDDAGFDGMVVDLTRNMNRIDLVDGKTVSREGPVGEGAVAEESVVVRAEAGASIRALAHFARRHGLDGAAFLGGIPGSVGGGLRMNAGAHGGEIKDLLVDVELLDPEGGRHQLPVAGLGMSYRRTRVPQGWLFLAARFCLRRGNANHIRDRIRQLNQQRRASQPLNHFSAGSTFKNPPAGPRAWQLIADAGLRGAREGDAQVSEKHCNFLINRGRATSREMLALIDRVRARVWQASGVELELEVGIVDRGGLRPGPETSWQTDPAPMNRTAAVAPA